MKQKEVLIGCGLLQYRITLSGSLSFNKWNPCRLRGSWMHTFRWSLMSRLCLVDPSRNCPSSTDPSWAFWHQILYVKMQIWHWSSTRGAALYLSEACLLLAILAQGSKKCWGGAINMQDGEPVFVQHILKRHFLLMSSGAMSVFLCKISGHWEIIF